jgi:hypothetical protein
VNRTFRISLIAAGLLGCALPTFATPSLCDAVQGNLVMNCGFETGLLSPWVRTEAVHDSIGIIVEFANSGDLDVAFNATGGATNSLVQTLATIPGQFYTFSLFEDADFDPNGQFFIDWNGANLLTITGQEIITYQFHTFTVMATSTSTDIRFAANTRGSVILDDVVVTPNAASAPEPSSVGFAAAGLCSVVLLRRRAARSKRRTGA